MPAMPASVICISHAEGAGGQSIGRLLAERTGFRYVDDGIVVGAARAQGLYPEAVSLAESRGARRELEVDFNRFERTETLRGLIREAISATADQGDVVIVAHAASYALARRQGVLRVLVTASKDTRALRVAEDEGVDAKSAAGILRESDKGRAAYLKHFYGTDRELPTDYDLVLNTDRLETGAAVDAIVAAAGTPRRAAAATG
jgi:cytidylate kinase